MSAIKEWQNHTDKILAYLSNKIVKELFEVIILINQWTKLVFQELKKI